MGGHHDRQFQASKASGPMHVVTLFVVFFPFLENIRVQPQQATMLEARLRKIVDRIHVADSFISCRLWP